MVQPRRTLSGVSLLLAVVLVAASGTRFRAQAPDAIVDRASRYVEAYEAAFSALVCEERQIQKLVRADGHVEKTRELRSDLLLVKIGTAGMPVFRDVLEVDGKPIKNRADRLRKLFLENPKTAMEQAQAIAKESQRYNIGLSRTGNSPILPIRILMPRVASGFRFEVSGSQLTFQEFRSPSFFRRRTASAVLDMMSHGSFEIDATGRVLAAELTAGGPPDTYWTTQAVRYREDPQLKLLVPIEMTERYWKPGRPAVGRLEVASSYSNIRRFQVSTDEQIKVPK